ncbi:undecaprenyl-phosphate alpha-N-acetylglucosaminyl 1-phosphate transferase [Photobacterium kishitanii]|uniref:UDP-N-acetylglucosamine--undecaprenyl-phosphate N-acetylglucosaminephosphotransferase n=1 Tax=Photobacterium kishitanii TaxID=318456 RepID=UPI000D168C77|nr:UDP-N-acetylglucosamine--undecaprenyl-phosphate N-acetylglucosaminephosphotransferase [Photobacterium kishitanii]PSW63170.1 undecaprenyl-phosphate alpha-N-acetylglucosaminyl 1-phosphate transferase [Photobacterium kishitanii]
MFTGYCFIFISSLIFLFVMRVIAKVVGLVDKPNERKHHKGAIPLVGGISIFAAISVTFLSFLPHTRDLYLYLSCALVLIILGAFDDRLDISFKIRLIVQAAISLAMIVIGGHSLHNLGFLMGSETIHLSAFISYIITVIGVIGAINAFNMVDGIDGLLGGLAAVTIGSMGVVFYLSGNTYLSTVCGLIVVAIIPYIMLNLGIPFGSKAKVFMGDAGSMFIGFTVVWLLIKATQDPASYAFKPVSALWLIAIPLMDMATIMIRRIRKGQSPFKPDREHLHHIFQRLGLSSRQTLLTICSMALVCSVIGLWSDYIGISESTMFVAFLVMFVCYFTAISHIFRIVTFVRNILGIKTHKSRSR